MITSLEVDLVSIFDGSTINSLTFTNVDSSEYIIKNIDGLGPVASTLSTYTTAFDPGEGVLTSQDGPRNIVLTIGFKPNYASNHTVSSLRQALARLMRPSQYLFLKFTDDVLGVRTINGYVETHEPTIFASEPTVQISIICNNPYFTGTAGYTTYTPTLPLVKAASPNTQYAVVTINCTSEVPVGFIMNAKFNTAIASPSFYLTQNLGGQSGPTMFGQNGVAIASGDTWEWSSIKGQRHLFNIAASAQNSQLYYLQGSLVTSQLMPGVNNLFLYDSGNVPRLSALSFKYIPQYLGL
jgi:hypothetical protein